MEEYAVTIGEHLTRRGVRRRQFLKFCGLMTATLALPSAYVSRVAQALTAAPRPRVVWLEFQDCTGDSESFWARRIPTTPGRRRRMIFSLRMGNTRGSKRRATATSPWKSARWRAWS